jgi:hypothetical protein
MIYKYFWQEAEIKDPSLVQDIVNGYFMLKTDDDILIIEENYVPLLELVNLLDKWDIKGRFVYCPEGYEQNPLISLQVSGERIEINSPDIRQSNREVSVTVAEFCDFSISFSRDVKKDVADMLAR